MFRRFERLVETYPDTKPATPPRTFFAFLWQSSAGLRPYILLMTLCTAVIGAFEAMLFAMLGQLVDWLANVEPARLWATQRQMCIRDSSSAAQNTTGLAAARSC